MRMWCHGYQSWSETAWRDGDGVPMPSGAPSLVRQMHGPEYAVGGLQSELVTMLDDDPTVYAGENVLLLVDGELQGATATYDSLEAWASAQPGRASAPFQVGWCSWYQYFDRVTEDDIRKNLALADGWPFEVFQIDDGFQSAIGDWLTTNDKFPSSLESLAADIARTGRRPGLWIAPFLAAPDSEVARGPSRLVRDPRERAATRGIGQRPLGWRGARARHHARRGGRAPGAAGP